MKPIADMSVEELAGLVCETLANASVTATLTGGACVAIWSEGKYVSRDLDFVEEGHQRITSGLFHFFNLLAGRQMGELVALSSLTQANLRNE